MNRNHRRYNRNQPNNQIRRLNALPPTPPVNNSTQNENSEGENPNGHNNSHIFPIENKKTWQYADTIAVLALIVGIAMTVVTYYLFDLGRQQAQSVIDAGNAAKDEQTRRQRRPEV